MTSHSTNWKQHYSSLPSNDDGNKMCLSFSHAMAASRSQRDRILALTEETDSIIFVADEEGLITVIHSPKNLGGTRTRPSNKVIGLVGMGPLATPVVLNIEQAVATCEIRTPLVVTIHACTTAEQFAALVAPDEDAVEDAAIYPGSAAFIPAPFVFDFFLNAESRNPADIVPALLLAAKRFDDEYASDPSYRNEALAHAEDFALWAWGVMTKSVPETRLAIRPDDGELKKIADERHRDNIFSSLAQVEEAAENPTTSGESNAALRQLSKSISLQIETSKETNKIHRTEFERRAAKDDAKKDRLKKLHKSILNQVLMASATLVDVGDGQLELLPPSVPVKSCRDFYAAETPGLAEQELNEQFKALKIPGVDFAHGTVQSLLAGLFGYNVGGSPSNLSAFCFCEQSPVQSSGPDQALILHLVATQGRGKTIEEIKASTKQKVVAPTAFEDLVGRIRYMIGICTILFGKGTPLISNLNYFKNDIDENMMAIKARLVEDNLYASKILYGMDTRIQRWLGKCKYAEDRAEVDDRIIDFRDIIEPMLNCQFDIKLPPVFTMTSNSTQGDTAVAIGGNPSNKANKRKRDDDDEDKSMAKMLGTPNPLFALKANEEWKDFCGVCTESRPMWDSEKRMCHRWNIRGFCFKNCKQNISHVEDPEIPTLKKTELKVWMAKVRASR